MIIEAIVTLVILLVTAVIWMNRRKTSSKEGTAEATNRRGLPVEKVNTAKEILKQSTESNNRSISKGSNKQPVAVHDILHDKNGNGVHDKNGFHNPTYIKDDDVFAQPMQCTKEDFGHPRRSRQVSDISELFRVPYADDKNLSELVFEELDKSKTLTREQSQESLDRLASDYLDREWLPSTDQKEKLPEPSVATNQLQQDLDPSSAVRDEMRSGRTGVDEDNSSTSMEIKCDVNKAKRTEWRDRLKQDLMDDDDDDFIDELSDDDDRHSSVRPVSPPNHTTDPESEKMRSNAKTSAALAPLKKLASGKPLVIDNGSYEARFGWAGEFEPAVSCRTVVGRWRAEASEAWQEALGSKFVGETAISRHLTLSLEHPIQDGKVTNWRSMQEVWDHVISGEIEADMTSHPVIVSESTNSDPKQRERMLEVLIETMRSPAVMLRNQAVLSSIASNRRAAIVVQSGHGSTEIVPVYEGYQISNGSSQVLPIGGRHITSYLARLAQRERGVSFTSVAEIETINAIKENYATVAADRQPPKQFPEQEVHLPDGKVLELGKEVSMCCEPLFDPSLVGNTNQGVSQLIKEAIQRLDPDIMTHGDNTILLVGGNAKLNGLKSRLQNELNGMPSTRNLTVQTADCCQTASWIGASLVADQTDFLRQCVTEDLYFEHGAKVVHRMCF